MLRYYFNPTVAATVTQPFQHHVDWLVPTQKAPRDHRELQWYNFLGHPSRIGFACWITPKLSHFKSGLRPELHVSEELSRVGLA